MAGYYDLYVLSRDRSKATVLRYLARFLPDREESQDGYALPYLSDQPDIFFASLEELLDHLEGQPSEPFGAYWHSTVIGDPRSAMIFPTSDGCMIYGLSVERQAHRHLSDVLSFLGAGRGYVTFESPPPMTAAAFDAAVERFENSDLMTDR